MTTKRKTPDSGSPEINDIRKKLKDNRAVPWRLGPVVLAGGDGSLRDSVQQHAEERARHFFLFMAQLDMVCFEHNRTTAGAKVKPADVIRRAASHQTDRGFRRKRDSRFVEWTQGGSQIGEAATRFRDQDAAHFSNMGISPTYKVQFDGPASSGLTKELSRELANTHGDTKRMPQLYNITVDAEIDEFQFEFAQELIGRALLMTSPSTLYLDRNGTRQEKSWNPFVTKSAIRRYISKACAKLTSAENDYRLSGRLTEADCCSAYIAKLQSPGFEHETFMTVHSNITAEAVVYVEKTGAAAGPGGPSNLFFSMN